MGKNDQLFKIFENYKDLNEHEDLSFVNGSESMKYLLTVKKLTRCNKDLKE